jgi:hypothetical protein
MSNEKEKEKEKEKKKKKGRPEEENFSQETGLPDYPTGLTGVHTTGRVDKVITVLQNPAWHKSCC